MDRRTMIGASLALGSGSLMGLGQERLLIDPEKMPEEESIPKINWPLAIETISDCDYASFYLRHTRFTIKLYPDPLKYEIRDPKHFAILELFNPLREAKYIPSPTNSRAAVAGGGNFFLEMVFRGRNGNKTLVVASEGRFLLGIRKIDKSAGLPDHCSCILGIHHCSAPRSKGYNETPSRNTDH